ncbi:MAG TPA: Hsp70 family protein [Phototrophicaceae bacterium]|jgi:molecular chaperone DnaK (HSP70)|nr:Hsp70 family protein [Phototrophicaceae bacterium]
MGQKLAIDFGTTNSVIARWTNEGEEPEIVALPQLSDASSIELPAVVPSLLYVEEGVSGKIVCGQAVRTQSLDQQRDNRLFRNFKRGIVASPAPEARTIDGKLWADRDAGRAFVKHIINSLPYKDSEIEQLVLTAPVASFEGYLAWLNDVIDEIAPDKIRVVDESTAAALGYAVTKPGAVVLVFDFGGGTLDLSLVQLPENREKTGGILSRLRKGNPNQHTAKVIAKAGRILGGSDIDQWLLAEVLKRTGLTPQSLGDAYATLLTACEKAKIQLSTDEQARVQFTVAGKDHEVTLKREELEALLEENGFFTNLRRVVDKVMHVARQRGIFKEDIHYVLMVGGTSLMPSVQRTLGQYFTDMAVRADKPFTAVAEGALALAAGFGLEDYLVHSYGLRHLNSETGEHDYDEIIPMGSSYPTTHPVEVVLSTAHDNQTEIEFVIGEIDTESISMVEVKYEDGQAVFVAQAGSNVEQQIIPLNEADALKMLAKLVPSGKAGEERIKAQFSINDRRQLRLTVVDLQSNKEILKDIALVTLR